MGFFGVRVERVGDRFRATPLYKMARGRVVRHAMRAVFGESVLGACRELVGRLVLRGDVQEEGVKE